VSGATATIGRRAVLGVLAAAALPAARAQIADVNEAINKAGRQRMLSQRMAKAWLAIGQGLEAERAQRVLAESITLFERQIGELKAYAPLPEIRGTYGALEDAWSVYRQALGAGAPSREATAELIRRDGAVLKLAHQGTLQLEKHAGRGLGRLVNLAGRQRMLSQRMAKFRLAQRWQVTLPEAAQELALARDEFVAALPVLREAPEATPAIRAELELAQQQWVFFDVALRSTDASRGLARDVFTSSENILAVMDRVTGLYARAAAA